MNKELKKSLIDYMSKNNIDYDKEYIISSVDNYINEIKLKERSIKLKKILKNGTKKL